MLVKPSSTSATFNVLPDAAIQALKALKLRAEASTSLLINHDNVEEMDLAREKLFQARKVMDENAFYSRLIIKALLAQDPTSDNFMSIEAVDETWLVDILNQLPEA